MKKFKSFSILVLMIGLVACGSKKEKATAEPTEATPKVKVAVVHTSDVEQLKEFTATVDPEVKNNIAPQAPGRIRKIFVEVGDRVSKGQKIAQMDNANFSNLESQIDNLKRVYSRVKGLYAVGGASQQELDNAKLQLDMAETNLKNMSENTVLTSPVNGIVTARNFDEGDMYNGQQPIATVMQISPVKVKINVSESYYTLVKKGMKVDVKVDLFQGENFYGNVSLIYPTIDDRTRTFGVEVKMNNANSKIRPGMYARVIMNFGTMKNVIVPDVAIVKQAGSGGKYVYIYKDGKVTFTEVQLGRRVGADFEILSGIEEGAQVVVAGQSKLADGMTVEVVK